MKFEQLTSKQRKEVIKRIKNRVKWFENWRDVEDVEFFSCVFVKNAVFFVHKPTKVYKPIFDTDQENQKLCDWLECEYRKVTLARSVPGFRNYSLEEWYIKPTHERNKYRIKQMKKFIKYLRKITNANIQTKHNYF